MRKLPSQTVLCTLFRYAPKSGVLTRWDGRTCGKKVSIKNADYWATRVVWKMQTGSDPRVVVPRDGDPSNLRWSNLMETSHSGHRVRGAAHSTSKTGLRGVYKVGARTYRAQVWWRGRKLHLGTFPSGVAAVAARKTALARLMAGKPALTAAKIRSR
jgi:hypothetical protein